MRARLVTIPSCIVAAVLACACAAWAGEEADRMAMRSRAPPAPEYQEAPKFVVLILACDSGGACNEVRRPFDADNEVACQMTSAMAMTRWMVENPGYVVKRFGGAKAGEVRL